MAIKGYKAKDVVSVYDPDRQAFKEVALPDLRRQLEALGFTPAEIEARLQALAPASEEG